MRDRAEVNMLLLPSRVSGMLYNILKLMQTDTKPSNPLLGSRIPLALAKDRGRD